MGVTTTLGSGKTPKLHTTGLIHFSIYFLLSSGIWGLRATDLQKFLQLRTEDGYLSKDQATMSATSAASRQARTSWVRMMCTPLRMATVSVAALA